MGSVLGNIRSKSNANFIGGEEMDVRANRS